MMLGVGDHQAHVRQQGRGFESFPVPGYGTDPDGNQHDMTKLVLAL